MPRHVHSGNACRNVYVLSRVCCSQDAYGVIAYIAMAYIVMAYIDMAYIVMAYIDMAYIVMA